MALQWDIVNANWCIGTLEATQAGICVLVLAMSFENGPMLKSVILNWCTQRSSRVYITHLDQSLNLGVVRQI